MEEFPDSVQRSTLTIIASQLIIGAGRAAQLLMQKESSPPHFPFLGIKAHLKGIEPQERIDFHCFDGGYLGISSIGNGEVNVACLAKKETMNKFSSIDDFMANLDCLRGAEKVFPQWLSCAVPPFGVKRWPNLPSVFFIGDAAGTIPPVTGEGLSMALSTGALVAEYVMREDSRGYKKAWNDSYARAIHYGLMQHHLLLHPSLTTFAMALAKEFKGMAPLIYRKTRAKISNCE